MKKILSLLLALSMAAALTACSGDSSSSASADTEAAEEAVEEETEAEAEEEEAEEAEEAEEPAEEAGEEAEAGAAGLTASYAFDAGSSAADGTTIDKLMNYFVSQAAEESDGAVDISYYGASQLGGDEDLVTSCLAGEVPFVIMNTSSMVSAVPELAVFDLAATISSSDIMTAVMADEEFSAELQSWFEAAGLHLCFYCPTVYKWLASTREIDSIDDFSGYTMRTLANEYQMALWEGAGAGVVQIAATELYLSIQQGLADGCEMDLSAVLNFDISEVTDYLYETRMYPHVSVCVMSQDLWEEMPEEDQAWFDSFFAEINDYYADLGAADEEAFLDEIEAGGTEVVPFSQTLFDELQAVAEEDVWPMIREDIGDEPVDAWMAAIERAEASN